MKNYIIIGLLFCFVISCNTSNKVEPNLYKVYENLDNGKIKLVLVNDSLRSVEKLTELGKSLNEEYKSNDVVIWVYDDTNAIKKYHSEK